MNRPLLAFLVASLGLGACSKDAPEAPAVVPAEERVRPIDLPSSRRSSDAIGSGAVAVLVAFDAIAIDGRDVLPLNRGALPAGTGDAAELPALAAALPAGRTEAHVRLHAATKFATLLSLVATLRGKGFERIGFDVRTDAMAEHTGVFVPLSIDARPASSEHFAFPEPFGRGWDVLTESWDDAYVACSGSPGSFDCSAVTENVAFGGDGEIALFRRGNGIILDFHRFNVGAQEGPPNPLDLMVGRNGRSRRRPTDAEAPASLASFGFRWESTTADPESPLATVMKAIAGDQPLGIRVSADANSDAGQIVTLVGSAFPNGVAAPAILLDAQRR